MINTEIFLTIRGQKVKVDAITSDTHWGHVNISKLAERPFDNSQSTADMDQFLVDTWNSVVKEDDTVLHLGDVAMGLINNTLLNVKKCNGRKILIPGNHDYIATMNSASRQENYKGIYAECFDEILPETGNHLTIVQDDMKVSVQLSHYPSSELYLSDGRKDKYAKYRPSLSVAPLIHGHTHAHRLISEEGRQLHVGVDAHDFKPVTADLIAAWAFSLPKQFFSPGFSPRPVDEPFGVSE